MTSVSEVLVEAGRRTAEGKAFALATVVAVRPPASTRSGDKGLITAEGALLGWVGGACSEPIVVREALRALADGRPRLVRIGPPDDLAETQPPPGTVLAESHCASGGTVEVLVEPQLPKPLVAIAGEGPAARTLRDLAAAIGWRVTGELDGTPDAIVVATMGEMDADVLEAALHTGAGYVGMIASSRRAGVVLAELRRRGVSEERLAQVRSPAGLDLGPGSQEEIAAAILAELVAWSHSRTASRLPEGALAGEAVDPVCGMTVALAGADHSTVHLGVRYQFCGAGCLARFRSDPDRYALKAAEATPAA